MLFTQTGGASVNLTPKKRHKRATKRKAPCSKSVYPSGMTLFRAVLSRNLVLLRSGNTRQHAADTAYRKNCIPAEDFPGEN